LAHEAFWWRIDEEAVVLHLFYDSFVFLFDTGPRKGSYGGWNWERGLRFGCWKKREDV
jgi:hypothetical protein